MVFLGALRAGAAVVPLPPSVTPASFRTMMTDAEARWLFFDEVAGPLVSEAGPARLIDLGAQTGGSADACPPVSLAARPFAPGQARAAGIAAGGDRRAGAVQ